MLFQAPKPRYPVVDAGSPYAKGLVGLWMLNEGAGLVTADAQRIQGAGTITTATWRHSPIGRGLQFGGLVSIVDSPTLSISTDRLTMFAWCRIGSANEVILCKPHASTHSDPFFKYTLYVNTADRIHMRLESSTLDTTTATPTGVEVTIFGTYDGADMRIFVNGLLRGGPTAKTGNLGTSTQAVRFGSNVGGGEAFTGRLYMAGIWHRALTPGEIHHLSADPCLLLARPFPLRQLIKALPNPGGRLIIKNRAA